MKICLSCEGVSNTQSPRCGHCGALLLPTDAVHYPLRRGERDAGNPLLGTVVDGKYRLLAVLGRGGLGTVFQALHIGTLVTVALKLLHPRFAERPEYRHALLPEARRAATVTHAGCARLLDVGEAEEGVAYLAMELVEGDTLDALLRGGPLLPSHAVRILQQIAEALAAIHAAGLVHCDLAPRNVMVAMRGGDLRVKVLDFGIARTVTMAGPEKARGGEFAGFVNPVFSAPELLASADVDVRADVYSFGSLAWLLLTGSPPVDDADPRVAARAVAAGALRPWPKVPGVPRRLQQLVARCVEHDRDRRPASAEALRQELAIVAGSRRPAIARAALAGLTVAIMATLATGADPAPPFLRLRIGSALRLADLASPDATGVQYLPSSAIETVGMHFGGFPADRLRVDVSRGGLVLLRAALQPEVDEVAGTLTLSAAQAKWRDLLDGLVRCSEDGPVDVSFVVPGRAPFGVARLRIDDTPPRLQCQLDPAEGVLTGASRLTWRCEEDTGSSSIAAEVELSGGRRVPMPLPADEGTIDFGAMLAELVGTTAALGPGRVRVIARDRAGNVTATDPLEFHDADVSAPHLAEVTGPVGEAFVPVQGEMARMRVRLSAGEAGCTLRLGGIDQPEFWRVALVGSSASQVVEVPIVTPVGRLASGTLWFVVEDAVGNRTRRQFHVVLRDQSVRIECLAVGPASKWLGRELVLGDRAAFATFAVGSGHRVVRADLELSPAVGRDETAFPVPLETEAQDRVRLQFPPLPPGGHTLRLLVEEGGGALPAVAHAVPVRVLPPVLEVRVPAPRSRFLPGLLEAGLLARREGGYGEGPGWRVDPTAMPYVRGTLWIGSGTLVPLSLPERVAPTDPLLPEIVPAPGQNVLAVELRDVLDRPVRVLVGEAPCPQMQHAGRTLDVVADFWWNDAPAVPIGEELLVEYGHPARLRVRLPLPFTAAERDLLLLGIAQSEIPATQITTTGDGAIALFDLTFAVWSVAAQLTGRTREQFAEQLTRTLQVAIGTPAGRYAFDLRLRTARSTLEPVTLGQLGAVPAEFAAMRLLPVLAPPVPFEEPVPEDAPPRALFRPQVATAVRDMIDILLQEREFTCGEARALMGFLERARRVEPARYVHRDDPLGVARLRGDAMLPDFAALAPADAPLTGVDYFQAWTFCRLLGLAVGDNPDLFRLPLGCELELAAYGAARRPACSGVAANGGKVPMAAFLAAAKGWERGRGPTAAESRSAGDVVPTGQGASFVGLDFGVREWVGDLPHVPGAELLLREWIADHDTHRARVAAFARGTEVPPPDLAGPLRTLGVVRGLALGEIDGLVDARGRRVDTLEHENVPDSVPGVLRTEQLCRDGRDLLTAQRDPRLARIGFRVVGTTAIQALLRGRK